MDTQDQKIDNLLHTLMRHGMAAMDAVELVVLLQTLRNHMTQEVWDACVKEAKGHVLEIYTGAMEQVAAALGAEAGTTNSLTSEN